MAPLHSITAVPGLFSEEITLMLGNRCVRDTICVCFIDSVHLLIQLLVSCRIFFSDAETRMPEETYRKERRRTDDEMKEYRIMS